MEFHACSTEVGVPGVCIKTVYILGDQGGGIRDNGEEAADVTRYSQ